MVIQQFFWLDSNNNDGEFQPVLIFRASFSVWIIHRTQFALWLITMTLLKLPIDFNQNKYLYSINSISHVAHARPLKRILFFKKNRLRSGSHSLTSFHRSILSVSSSISIRNKNHKFKWFCGLNSKASIAGARLIGRKKWIRRIWAFCCAQNLSL